MFFYHENAGVRKRDGESAKSGPNVLLERNTTLTLSIDAGFFYFVGVTFKSLRAVSDRPGPDYK